MVDAALVAPACESGVDESGDTGFCHVGTDEASAERKHIGVIMFAGKLGGDWIVDTGTAAFRLAIDGDGNTNPRSANCNAAVGVSGGDRASEPGAIFRIVDAFGPVSAEVFHVVALLTQPEGEFVLEQVSGMIGGDGYAHGS